MNVLCRASERPSRGRTLKSVQPDGERLYDMGIEKGALLASLAYGSIEVPKKRVLEDMQEEPAWSVCLLVSSTETSSSS